MRLVVCSAGIKRKETKNVRKKDGLKGSISNLLEIVIVFLFFCELDEFRGNTNTVCGRIRIAMDVFNENE